MIITLLTDFGTSDYFVAAMKGVILGINPNVQIIDISHHIPPHDIKAAAFNLLVVYKDFPEGTIHVAIVDPGVGSSRRPLLVVTSKYFFIGPDNGLFSYICEREVSCHIYHLKNQEYFRPPLSSTFHGRDIFAPVAGALSKSINPDNLGELINDYVKLGQLALTQLDDKTLKGFVLHVDHFGNCITNITREDLTEMDIHRGVKLVVNQYEIKSFRKFYTEESTEKLFALWGSAGFLEISALCNSAANLLSIKPGQELIVEKL
jgi:S-adenosyl-L-methionine hydrolase (adenosine-forming)